MSASLPVGGTTGFCRESSAAIAAAARWIVEQGDTRGRALVPEIRTRFGLTSLEACEAIREAQLIRARAI